MIAVLILLAVLVFATGVGILVRRNEGRVRATGSKPAAPASDADSAAPESNRAALLAASGLIAGRPTVLHFSADWCGPCAAVRRVVASVVSELAGGDRPPLDLELDIDANPELARELNVLSLPTTFVFDSRGLECFRISGVPKAADLRSSLAPLTVSTAAE